MLRRPLSRFPSLCPPPALSKRFQSNSAKSEISGLTQAEILNVLKSDGRQRLTRFWTPTGGITEKDDESNESHSFLIRSGFLRQAYSGVFHFLPLGLRVQDKLERIIDKHMRSLGASKVSLSSISSEELWSKTGRLENKELLRIQDRRESGFLLGPTHEEEITQLVANTVKSYKELPLRLYQISRKYRDELRPRQGLLRAKEFLMKDMYTFDHNEANARATYDYVRQAYANILAELKMPYLVAKADSGAIGGDLSHEYHFISDKGEDTVFACDSCDYVANEEVAVAKPATWDRPGPVHHWKGVSKDRKTLYVVAFMTDPASLLQRATPANPAELLNLHAVKAVCPDLDTAVETDAEAKWAEAKDAAGPDAAADFQVVHIADANAMSVEGVNSSNNELESINEPETSNHTQVTPPTSSLLRLHDGSACPSCAHGHLRSHRAIEVGHTFHLGTRYSAPLSATCMSPAGKPVLLAMGCHGIGVSRTIGAVAGILADERGLNWPRAIAPFEVVVVQGSGIADADAASVYDLLVNGEDGARGTVEAFEVAGEKDQSSRIDAVWDDREASIGWKLRDADMVGYNVIVTLGRGWKDGQKCEVQCRRLGLKQVVHVDRLRKFVLSLLEQF
ncbi:uncharacterized protein K452DRAFT_315701 [Aplosporella prunicola CBS 121167]|uniref:proline--tRNA ligase n=1 Tax=Aplosporella prunicola CBS 121167 TaxID=1176127 RepID=A0A6A6BMW2_9PEZI|nr:uncharacterized protein K452DRAFT_315701 [Aplosporella prunicola CBS 121167]KAF2145460.1 hypothetical protein K452DRAFT_315701 [Aplosporella prunicola CBS 121167]